MSINKQYHKQGDVYKLSINKQYHKQGDVYKLSTNKQYHKQGDVYKPSINKQYHKQFVLPFLQCCLHVYIYCRVLIINGHID